MTTETNTPTAGYVERQLRMLLMATGALTLEQVDRWARESAPLFADPAEVRRLRVQLTEARAGTPRTETRVTFFPPDGGIKHLKATDLEHARQLCRHRDVEDAAPLIEQRQVAITAWVIVENVGDEEAS